MVSVTDHDEGSDIGETEPRDTEPTQPIAPSSTGSAGSAWLPPLHPPREEYDATRPLAHSAAPTPTHVPWWMWATVCGLALAIGLFGGAVGSLLVQGLVDDTPGLVARGLDGVDTVSTPPLPA